MILLQVDGIPVPWRAHGGYGRKSFNPRFREKEYYVWQLKSQYNQIEPIAAPVKMEYTYHMPIPITTSRMRRMQMLNGMMHPMKRPDLDNLNKFLSDCLIGIIILDDSQIVELKCSKIYSERPHTLIKVEAICH